MTSSSAVWSKRSASSASYRNPTRDFRLEREKLEEKKGKDSKLKADDLK